VFCVGKSVNHESSADYVNGVNADSPYLEDHISRYQLHSIQTPAGFRVMKTPDRYPDVSHRK